MTIRTLIADDEPLAREKLRDLLRGIADVECVGETRDGPETIASINQLHPDLVFLDIRMPGASGLEVLERVQVRPHVVFTTAYDRYAVTAFELQALDYLLKPFGRERLEQAMERARRALARGGKEPTGLERTKWALEGSDAVRRLFLREGGRIVPVSMDRVELLEAGDEYVTLHVGSRKYLIGVRLRDLERRLDPERFLRVHRSYIVNLDYVEALAPYDGARLKVNLKSGKSVVASRARSKNLRKLAL